MDLTLNPVTRELLPSICFIRDSIYPSIPLLSSLPSCSHVWGSEVTAALLSLSRLVLPFLPFLLPQTELCVRKGCWAPVCDHLLPLGTWRRKIQETIHHKGRNVSFNSTTTLSNSPYLLLKYNTDRKSKHQPSLSPILNVKSNLIRAQSQNVPK